RVLRTLRELGIPSVAVYSEADAAAPHVADADEAVPIGPAPARESYLRIDALLEAARRTGADALHPGYGFLSENAELARRCAEAGVVFIGPSADVIRRMGSKIEAKALMASAGVPVIPGVECAERGEDALAAEAAKLGFPVLVKASAGGGGRGMRIVTEASGLPKALAAARREAEGAFGDGALLLEKYFEAPRHIEVQIFGDAEGNVLHLFERECSIQRRHQKVIEESPSPAVDERLRSRLGEAAVAAGKALGYVGAGTVEFVLDARGEFHFLEVNTRLQVEHPVTEAVTGLDLVALQLHVAAGGALPFGQDALAISGHAIEARLYAEDPQRNFLPATGALLLWEPEALPGVRVDSGVEQGSVVGVHYDPLLAKVVAHAPTRDAAARRLARALRGLAIGGIRNNRDFLVAALEHPAFLSGALDTHFIERHLPPERRRPERDEAAERASAVAAALYEHAQRRAAPGPQPPGLPSGWRNNRSAPQVVSYELGAAALAVRYVAQPGDRFAFEVGGASGEAVQHAADARGIDLEIDGVRRRFRLASDGRRVFVHSPLGAFELARVPRFPAPRGAAAGGGCVAPMTGVVRAVNVAPGDRVQRGAVLAVIEAMKMEHPLVAHADGVVREVHAEVGQRVDPDDVLVVIESPG
ncbi:MAG TPA: biotin carboxylase N-terminal domain-containing protein, partial [Myxococcota bacterium]